MDAMRNDSASATALEDAVKAPEAADGEADGAVDADGAVGGAVDADGEADGAVTEAADEAVRHVVVEAADESAVETGAEVPQPRSGEPGPDPEPTPVAATAATESGSGKSAKKRKAAPKSKSAGMKSLVVLRDGKVHYADETVVVLDLDDAAHPDTDVHDVVDKLTELRDAVESPGRTEAVSLVAELIQTKALA